MSHTLTSSPHARPSLFNLAALALIMLMGGLGIAYWLDASAKPSPKRTASEFSAPFVSKDLLGSQMNVPQAWLNTATQNASHAVEYLDLELNLSFASDAQLAAVKIHFASANDNLPSAQLLDSVYLLRFTQAQIPGPNGLIGKPLRAEEGYQSETVWYDPVSSNPFVAKCIDLGSSSSAPNCLRTVQFSPRIALTYQFSENLLVRWRTFDVTMATLLEKLHS